LLFESPFLKGAKDTMNTAKETRILIEKSGTAKSLFKRAPSNSSVTIICDNPRTKAPINLSGNDITALFLKRKICQDKNKRRFTMIYETVFT
jgi:hypothetical protein